MAPALDARQRGREASSASWAQVSDRTIDAPRQASASPAQAVTAGRGRDLRIKAPHDSAGRGQVGRDQRPGLAEAEHGHDGGGMAHRCGAAGLAAESAPGRPHRRGGRCSALDDALQVVVHRLLGGDWVPWRQRRHDRLVLRQ